MSTHNICFRGEIGKIFSEYPLLSEVMYIFVFQNFEGDPFSTC